MVLAFVICLLCVFHSYASFVFTRAVVRPLALEATDRWIAQVALSERKGSGLAHRLEDLFQSNSSGGFMLRAGEQHHRRGDGGEADAARADFMKAQGNFEKASSRATGDPSSQAIKGALRAAIGEGSAEIGKPQRPMPRAKELSCQPDYTSCPQGYRKQGMLCFAQKASSGECAQQIDIFSMSFDARRALGSACKFTWKTVCQREDCAQNFASHRCPLGWREVSVEVCQASRQYVGGCSRVLDARGMSDKDKQIFGVQCGVSWPCALQNHDYRHACPGS